MVEVFHISDYEEEAWTSSFTSSMELLQSKADVSSCININRTYCEINLSTFSDCLVNNCLCEL